MDDAIEAVARALAVNLELDDSAPEEMWPAYVIDAKAAIEAHLEWLKASGFAVVLVEPTEAMLDEGCLHWTDMDAEQAARDIYRAMIATAKGDG